MFGNDILKNRQTSKMYSFVPYEKLKPYEGGVNDRHVFNTT